MMKSQFKRRESSKASFLNPPPLLLLLLHGSISLSLLFFVAQTPASRLVLLLLSLSFEGFNQFFSNSNKFPNKWMDKLKLLSYLVVFCIHFFVISNVNMLTTVRELEVKGVPVPPKDFPGGTSGDPRVINGPNGIVKSPFVTLDEASAISAIVTSAIHDEHPFITGDDFSIIIPGRDEELYISKTIMFTIDNTPAKYIKEIIVVDDASKIPMSEVLDKELPARYRKMVKVFRFDKKEGLIRARIYGADRSTGSNIFFLDGHCKPKKGWIEPLLKHLKANYKRLACPVIEDIRKDTWEDAGTSGAKMMFEWNFEFGWYDDLTDEVPISAGGIIALTRKWWDEGGKYDPGMLEWGGENLEQSMRFWMCGGEVFVVRNSFVGHIFDRPAKPNPGNRLVTQVQKNQKRAALVWLGDFYKYFEEFHPVVKSLDEGPGLEDRIALRDKLNCRPFQWYVNKFKTSFERKGLLVDEFRYIIHPGSRWCLTAAIPTDAPGAPKFPLVVLDPCRRPNFNQQWQTVAGGRMLFNRATGKCLAKSGSRNPTPVLKDCDWTAIFEGNPSNQFWQFDGLKSGRIFSYPTDEYKTLTGNDRMSIDTDAAQSTTSSCLSSSLRFWDLDKTESSTQPNSAVPVDALIEPCQRSNGTLGNWEDSQLFEWHW